MSTIFYCKGWFRAKKRPLEAYTFEKARALHNDGELYCALVGSEDRPTCFLEIARGFVGVGFLDEMLRERLSYAFQEVQPGQLFLSMATWREFDGDSDRVSKGTTYVFRPGGTLHIRREEFIPQHLLETTNSTAEIAGNWERFPVFGGYERLIRAER